MIRDHLPDLIVDYRDGTDSSDGECFNCRGRGWTWTLNRGYEDCTKCGFASSVRVLPPLYDWQKNGDL